MPSQTKRPSIELPGLSDIGLRALPGQQMHRLHLMYPEGSGKGSVKQALVEMSNVTPSQRAFLMKMGEAKDPRFSDAFIRLVQNEVYADKVLNVYRTEIKPALNL